MIRRRRVAGVLSAIAVTTAMLAACGGPAVRTPATGTPATPAGAGSTPQTGGSPARTPGPGTSTATSLPRPAHVVVAIFENKAYGQIAGSPMAPWFNGLLATSALFTNARAITHPSQPNYLALFSGSTQGVTDDHCPVQLGSQDNLASQLNRAGLSFTGYAEGLPAPGYRGCSQGRYAAKHNPWADFDTVPGGADQPFSAFPSDLSTLPTIAFVVPDLCHDMHDCSIATGDTWARSYLDRYLSWARSHNSLLIVTFDENDNSPGNQIFTVVAGAGVRAGRYSQPLTHYGVLATIEAWYGLARLGGAATATPITGIWSAS